MPELKAQAQCDAAQEEAVCHGTTIAESLKYQQSDRLLSSQHRVIEHWVNFLLY